MELMAGRARRRLASPSAILWAYALAILAVGSLPRLPSFVSLAWFAALLLGGVLLLPARARWLPLLLAALAGAGWALWHDRQALDQRLPLEAHGGDFSLEVEVVSLPQVRESSFAFGDDTGAVTNLRFSVRVLRPLGRDPSPSLRGQLLDLTWYRIDESAHKQLRAGSRWILSSRLKRPRGSVNPHGFDYEGWLLQRGVYATGYVLARDFLPQYLGDSPGLPALRHWLRDRLLAEAGDRGALLCALLLGDRSGLSDGDRRLLRETGTAHLLAISGLHVGMVAAFLLLLGGLLGRVIGLFTGGSPRAPAVILALAGALAYTLLAGAPLSARRALVMTWVLLLAWQWRRRIGAGLAFILALALVLTLQPLAFYDAGFWLSFIAVAALLLGFSGRLRLAARGDALRVGAGRWLLESGTGMLRSQWLVAVALLLPSLVFFSGFSPAGVLLNLVAIPWLGFLVLPPLMLGALMSGSSPGGWCIDFAAWQLDLLMGFLEMGRDLLPAWQTLGPPVGAAALVLAAAAALLLLLPAGLPGRRLGWLFLLPPLLPFLPSQGEDSLRVTVLDVGQGLAVVLSTPRQRLLYDTGPLSGSGWSAGSQVVAPYLLGEGIAALDTVIVSHGDRDHAGGFGGLAEILVPDRIVAPGQLADRLGGPLGRNAASCRAGESETLGDLDLQWLWPESATVSGEDNDHSCVALVQWRGVRILLTGDISASVERQLSRRFQGTAPVDLLIAPHHGSRSSSSVEFIRWAGPRRVVFSAGFRHHFGHPHADVVARYRASGAELFNTAETGALEFIWAPKGPRVENARAAPRFWYADHTDEGDVEWRFSRRDQLW